MTEAPSVEPNPTAPAQGLRWFTDWRLHFWGLALIALVPRLIYLVQIHHWPFFYFPILDSRTQNMWAEILLQSLGVGNAEVLAKPPLYMYFLALTKLLVGRGDFSLLVARLLQLLMGAATCGLTYLVGRRVFGVGVGLVAGLLLALYSPGIFNDGELLDTALSTLLATSLLLALLGSFDKPTGLRWFGVGLLLGALGLTRGNLLLFAPLVLALVFVWLRGAVEPEERRRFAGLFLLGLVVMILPITARNAIVTGTFLPISNNGGINFYTGSNSNADGYTPILSGIAWERTWYEKSDQVDETGARRTVGSLFLVDQDRFWMRRGIQFWRQQLASALALLFKKACLYWTAYDIPNNVSYDWARSHASLLRAMPFTFAIVGPLALLGIALGGWRSRSAWLLTLFTAVQWLAVIVFFVNGRYRMHAVPALCVLAGYAAVEIARRVRGRKWTALAPALIGLVVFGLFVNADLYGVGRRHGGNRDWFFAGQSYLQMGNFAEARQAFGKATEANPKDADAWFYLGNAAQQTGDIEVAGRALRHTLQLAPDYSTAGSRLGEIAMAQGLSLKEPEALLARAVQSQPSNVESLATLVRLQVRLGMKDAAEHTLMQTAAAFAHRSQNDTRYASAQAFVMQAAAEAEAAGIVVPQALRPQQESQ